MVKVMVSLSTKAEKMVRNHIKKKYRNKVGALSIFFDQLVMDYFAEKKVKPPATSEPEEKEVP